MESLLHHLNEIENKNAVIKRIIVKMVLILEMMHKHGVIHRDLKVIHLLSSPRIFYSKRTARSSWLISEQPMLSSNSIQPKLPNLSPSIAKSLKKSKARNLMMTTRNA